MCVRLCVHVGFLRYIDSHELFLTSTLGDESENLPRLGTHLARYDGVWGYVGHN